MRTGFSAIMCISLLLLHAYECSALDEKELIIAKRAADGPRAIIDKAIAAVGGEEAVAKQRLMQMKIKAVEKLPRVKSDEILIEWTRQLPNQCIIDLGPLKDRITVILNGDMAVFLYLGNEIPIKSIDEVRSELAEALYVEDLSHLFALKDQNIELAPGKEILIDNKPAVGVKVSAKGHRDVTLYFDKATSLLVKREQQVKFGEDLVSAQVLFSDYRECEGVKHWHKISLIGDERPGMDCEVTEIKFLQKLDAAVFDFPAIQVDEVSPARAFVVRANYYNKLGAYDKVIADANEAIRLDPSCAATYLCRGDALAGKGKLDDAINNYTAAMRMNREDVAPYHRRAAIYEKKGQFDDAIRNHNVVIQLKPDDPQNYLNRARAYRASPMSSKQNS